MISVPITGFLLLKKDAVKETYNSYEVYLIFPQHKEKNIKENLI